MKKKIIILLIVTLFVFAGIFYRCLKKNDKYFISNFKKGIEEMNALDAEGPKDSEANNGGNHPGLMSFSRPQYLYFVTEEMTIQSLGDLVILEWIMKKEEAEQFTHINVRRRDGSGLVAVLTIEDAEKDGDLYKFKVIDNEEKNKDIEEEEIGYGIGGISKDPSEISVAWPPEKKSSFTFSNLCIWILSWFK